MSNHEFTFSKTYSLLQDEGFLFHSCLTHGLTQMRNGAITDKGAIYSALFNTGIGLERLQKVVYIIDYMLTNNQRPPGQEDLRKLGHDIETLNDRVKEISIRYKLENGFFIDTDLRRKIIKFLSEFSKQTRYYNFNNLAAEIGSNPIAEWCDILLFAAQKHLSSRKLEKIIDQNAALGSALSEIGIFIRRGSGNHTLSPAELLVMNQIQREASKYTVMSILELLHDYRSLLSEMCRKVYFLKEDSPAIPQMQEFLDWAIPDPEFCLRKLRWP